MSVWFDGVIRGTVWEDTNNDDIGDTPQAGVTVVLKDSVGEIQFVFVTGPDGKFEFAHLPPGDWIVEQYNNPGYVDVSDVDGGDPNVINVTLTDTELVSEGNDFVDERLGTISGTVWEDTNNDDIGDTTQAGVTVTLKDGNGNVVGTAVTDANGYYEFTDLPAGSYTVEQTNLPGLSDVSDVDGGNPNSIAVVLSAGGNVPGNDFVDERLGAIRGTVWEDTDNNDSGDTPQAGVVVKLYKDGVYVTETVTDANGRYEFTDLPAGNYSLMQVNKPGYADVSDTDGANDNLIAVALPAGGVSEGNDFVDERLGTISGTVWEDLNNDDVGDTPQAGVTVTLKDGNGNVVGTAVTDASGYYEFTGLTAGAYTVEQTNLPGLNDVGDIDGGDPNSIAVSLPAGGNVPGNDFVDERLGTISGTVWEDTDNDDIGDVRQAGVTVTLKDGEGNVVGTAVTDANGYYEFTDLPAGAYTVEQTNLPDMLDVNDVDGGDPNSIAVNLPAGGNVPGNDFVDEMPVGPCLVSIGDRVWLDANANGIQDDGEQGVAGVTVKLVGAGDDGEFGTDDDIGATTTTDADGQYLFNDLEHGSYKVQIDVPTGYNLSQANVGTDDEADSDFVCKTTTTTTTQTVTRDLIVNGSFEEPGMTSSHAYYSAISGWRGYADYIEVGKASTYGVKGASGALVVELDANSCRTGGLYQTVATEAGKTYTLSFDAAMRSGTSSSTNSIEVWWAGKKIATVDPTSTTMKTYTFTVTGTGGNDQLLFKEQSCDDNSLGGMLDNVKLLGTYTTKVTTVAGKVCESDVIVIDSCEDNLSIDAGLYQKASIGDRVWLDANKNGVQDSGEAGVAGVTVNLLNAAGTVVATTTTDAEGNYLFGALVPGDYAVQVETPEGYAITGKDMGGDDARDSDVDAATGKTVITTLTSGENDTSWDAGLVKACTTVTLNYDFSGNTSGDGSDGNTRSYSDNGVSVNVSAFSRTSWGTWSKAYVGAFSGGLGVTDSSESGSGVTHTIDNNGRDNYLVFEFSADVVIDKAFLGYVYNDSDMTVWIGNIDGAFSNHVSLNDSVLSGMGFTEINNGGSSTRWADLNVGNYTGNVLVVAAKTSDSNDYFKLEKLVATSTTCAITSPKASIGDKVWEDADHDNIQDANESGIGGVKVSLQNASGVTIATTTTDASGNYKFTGLDAGTYRVVFDKSSTVYKGIDMSNWNWAAKDVGANDAIDADAYSTSDVAYTAYFDLAAGANDMSRDAGITPIVIDLNGDGIQTVSRADATGAFDILGTGQAIVSGWISGNDGFLAVDANGNGSIDSIAELFGGTDKGDGFAKLASYDSNGDGVVDASDAGFASLLVWQDANGNHQTDDGELMSLADAGVASLAVGFTELPFMDANGNLHLERSSATLADGSTVDMTDVYFNVSADDAAAAGVELPSLAELMGDDSSLDGLLAGFGCGALMAMSTADSVCAGSCAADVAKHMVDLYDQAIAV